MKKKNSKNPKMKMYCLVSRVRKKGFEVDSKQKIIYFNYDHPESLGIKEIRRLCVTYGYVPQARLI